jgi:signal transduction histidine kinase
VTELRKLTAQALDDVRRVSLDLRPTILDDLGLAPALEWRVDEFTHLGDMTTTLSIHGLGHRLPPEMELVFYRTAQEALSNIAKHANAATVDVQLWTDEDSVCLKIEDDGCGFIPRDTVDASGAGLGLLGMRERLGMIGGNLQIESTERVGTVIFATAPLPVDWQATDSEMSINDPHITG